MPNLPYATAKAFRQALLDRLRAAAGPEADPQQLLKEFAFDRLLTRAFTAEPDAWVLKGAAGLSSQLSVARHTHDIDLWLREPVPQGELKARLQTVAGIDLDDFTVIKVHERGRIVGFADVAGWRFTATLQVDRRPLHRFGVDVVVGAGAFGEPEHPDRSGRGTAGPGCGGGGPGRRRGRRGEGGRRGGPRPCRRRARSPPGGG
jgi:hypothetical protein